MSRTKSLDLKIRDFILSLQEDGYVVSCSINHDINKFELKVNGIDEFTIKENVEAEDAENTILSKRYGFSQNIIGLDFEYGGEKFKVIRFKTQNRKYPIIATRLRDKKGYKFTPKVMLESLGGNNIINRNVNLNKFFDEKN